MTVPTPEMYPMVELAIPSRAHLLVEPHAQSPTHTASQDHGPGPQPRRSQLNSKDAPVRTHRESYDLSGSTYLISNTGKTLKLPVPSQSRVDPLNWSRWKTSGAMLAVLLFSVVNLTAVQGVSVISEGVEREFKYDVG